MRCDRNHNKLWLDSWELRENYGAFIAALFQGFAQENPGVEAVEKLFNESTGCKLPGSGSAVKDKPSNANL